MSVCVCVFVFLSVYQAATKIVRSLENTERVEDALTLDSSLSETANDSTEDEK